jgi:hypothetical protein
MTKSPSPTSFFWRHADEFPFPAPEGTRRLLLWEDGEVWDADYSISTRSWLTSGAEREPGLCLEGVWWCWADGDPYTRSSPEARRADKEAWLRQTLRAAQARSSACYRTQYTSNDLTDTKKEDR